MNWPIITLLLYIYIFRINTPLHFYIIAEKINFKMYLNLFQNCIKITEFLWFSNYFQSCFFHHCGYLKHGKFKTRYNTPLKYLNNIYTHYWRIKLGMAIVEKYQASKMVIFVSNNTLIDMTYSFCSISTIEYKYFNKDTTTKICLF